MELIERKIRNQKISMAIIQIAVLLLVIPGIYGVFGWLGLGCWVGLGYLAHLTRKQLLSLRRSQAIAMAQHLQGMISRLRADLGLKEQEHERD